MSLSTILADPTLNDVIVDVLMNHPVIQDLQRMTAEQNFAFSAGNDVVVFPRDAVITQTAGDATGKYLSILVNGVPYRISLLAQPTFTGPTGTTGPT